MKLHGLILAGGYSQRMGQDKALLEFNGKPQIEHVHDLLRGYCGRVFISKRTNQLPYQDIPYINDLPQFDGLGPLGGIASAMHVYPKVTWLVMACDLPLIDKNTLEKLTQYRDLKSIATAYASTYDGLPEPLCAIWEVGSLGLIEQFIRDGIKCPRKVLIKAKASLITQDDPHWLDNVNTPQELNLVQKKITTTPPGAVTT